MKFFSCLFSHGHTIHVRDAEGRLALQCEDCGTITPVLQSAVVVGPAHQAVKILGQPSGSARTVRHIRAWKVKTR